MATIALFHHLLGLTPGIQEFATLLRERGHEVHTPDLFEGELFADIESGLTHAEAIGISTLIERAQQATMQLRGPVVYGGFSLGVLAAQTLLQTRENAAGGLFFHSFITPSELAGSWPGGLPVQIHAMDEDPFVIEDGDLESALAVASTDPLVRVYTYPGSGHLFTDSGSSDFDAGALDLAISHASHMLAQL